MSSITECSPLQASAELRMSPIEAQCAALLDKLGWEWRYRPSVYVSGGTLFEPNFLVFDGGMFIACQARGTETWLHRVNQFRDLVATGLAMHHEDHEAPAKSLLVFHGSHQPFYFSEGRCAGAFIAIHCLECGWHPAALSTVSCAGMNIPEVFCQSCLSPMSPGRRWDGKARIDRVASVTISRGRQILVNGEALNRWRG